MNKNVAEAEYTLTHKPVFSTSIERVKLLYECRDMFAHLPQPIRFAKTLYYLLSRVSLPVKDCDIIIGRAPDRELDENEERFFQSFLRDPKNPYLSWTFLGSGHSTYDWEMFAELGFSGILEKIRERKSREKSGEKLIFLEGMEGVCLALINYVLRYEKAVRERGMTKQANMLKAIAARPPETFYEAIGMTWIMTLINCSYITLNPTMTLGRMDIFLYPFYKRDIERGLLTREEAGDIITDYYCKHNLNMGRGEHQVGDAANSTTFDRILNFDAPQYLPLAGTDRDGKCAVNDLTLLFAERIQPRFKNPVIVVRYFEGMDRECPELWKILTRKAMQSSSMMFYNDNDVIEAMKRMGLGEDSRNYVHFGCNWPAPGANSTWMHAGPHAVMFDPDMDPVTREGLKPPAGRIKGSIMQDKEGLPGAFKAALSELASSGREDVTIEDFYRLYFDGWRAYTKENLAWLSRELKGRQRKPSALLTYTDLFTRESIERAECIAATSKYHFNPQSFGMFGTVVDCFITVDALVFREKKVTLKELDEAVKNNFEGFERLRLMCKAVPKYGSDSELSDYHTNRIAKESADIIFEESKPYFESQGLFVAPCLQCDTWHLKRGKVSGATPDGRRAGESFAQNSHPSNGACVNGLTGMLSSMLNIPAGAYMSGALNLDIDDRQFAGEEGRENFARILAAYFNNGGLHAQVSCVSRDDLIAAQKDPDSYRDLRVRVTGYSGIFVDLCSDLQNDIINRMS